ncbi:MAG: sugar ABC transporter ATP-binding protein [Chloroflexi bacterium]|nr:sugar ABC transporter ATP-binding protein [Chloroflexota bacterium]
MPQPSLLFIHQASKSYSGIPALIDASLELRAGEVHALMGENGAGKSTLIRILAGVITPDKAAIRINGQPVHIRSPHDAFGYGLRFIHQELHAVPQLSVAENILLGQPYPTLLGFKVRWKQLNSLAQSTLDQLGLSHIDPRRTMAHLSPGDQMLVNIARAFVGDDIGSAGTVARVYVMDEPTAALTGTEIEQLFRVIGRLRDRGSAILYVSHRMDEIFQIADRVTVMRDGRIIGTQDKSAVTPSDLILMMTERELDHVFPARTDPVSPDVLLDVRGLTTRFIHNISFALHRGEILGVAGLIGAGRSELLGGLIGADRHLAGEIHLDGRRLRRMSPARTWKNQIAFVPEERRSQGLVLSRSIGNNITLPQLGHFSRAGAFLDHRRERSTSRTLGESVRLRSHGPSQSVRELSGGNQQKVVFARALARPPRVLLLDEPTRGVDIGAKVDIYHLIREISARGTGIILVSSDLPELLGMTDRILILRDGRLAAIVPAKDQTQNSLLARCYGDN